MSVVCFTAGILCLIYYLIIVIYAGFTASFAWIWIFLGGVLECCCVLLRYGRHHPGFFPGWLKYAVAVAVLLLGICFAMICSLIISKMGAEGEKNLEYVVVLGAQVRGDEPSKALGLRLKKALLYARENPKTVLILSGGQGPGENITEAQCMKEYLVLHGIPEERLILEEKSTSTRENLLFSDELTGCSKKKTGILSNNFHVYRACKLAKKLGYEKAEGIAAASDPIMQIHYVVREVLALVKEMIKGNI